MKHILRNRSDRLLAEQSGHFSAESCDREPNSIIIQANPGKAGVVLLVDTAEVGGVEW